VLHLEVSKQQLLNLDKSTLQRPVLLLEESTSQGPELNLNVSTLQRPVLLLEVSSPQMVWAAYGHVHTPEACAAPEGVYTTGA
jgi:hypothetical protein